MPTDLATAIIVAALILTFGPVLIVGVVGALIALVMLVVDILAGIMEWFYEQ